MEMAKILHSKLHHIIIFVSSLFLFSNFSVSVVNASIHDYKNQAFVNKSNAFFFHGGSEVLYASKLHHSSSNFSPDKPIKGRSFIRFEGVTFMRTNVNASAQKPIEQSNGVVEAIILEAKDRERIGGAFLKSNVICCDPKLSDEGLCKLGEVIIQKNQDNPHWPKRITTSFAGTREEATMEALTVEINSTGMYYIYFMFCNPQLEGTLIKGRTVWKNPNGYLPGELTPLMILVGVMSLAHLALGLVWFLRFVQHWKHIKEWHYYITAVIAIEMCEMAVWYIEYSTYNVTGTRPMGVTLKAVTITTFKKTLSRLLVLAISMGYGVVKPTLGLIYFVAFGALELVIHIGNINKFSAKTELLLEVPVTFLDCGFFVWYMSSVFKALEKPKIRRIASAETKLLACVLAVSMLLYIPSIVFECYFNANDQLSELWQVAWIIPAFWTVVAYFVLVVMCVIWAPSRNPTRYAYWDEMAEEFDKEGTLTNGGSV